jgi:hypothetical protein
VSLIDEKTSREKDDDLIQAILNGPGEIFSKYTIKNLDTVVSYGIQVTSDDGHHVHFYLHAGPFNSRGLAGSLCLRKDEFQDFASKLKADVKR